MRLHTEPDTDRKNIFQLWRENGEAVPFKVAKSSWSAEAGHFLIVERVEVKKVVHRGQYHCNGVPGTKGEKVNQSGTFAWRKK